MSKRKRRQEKLPTLARIDLHGLRVEEALKALDAHLNKAIIADVERIEVIHGHGTGRLQVAIHEYLTGMSVVESFKLDEVNAGVTWVYL